jgi:tetratricopeptide (TPR) repeat protein
MMEQEPENWLVYAYSADRYALDCKYEKAIELNKKAYELQPSPKYTDASECIAHIYEITGEYEKAIKAWEELILVLQNEWHITEGEAVDRPRREIERLREMSKSVTVYAP